MFRLCFINIDWTQKSDSSNANKETVDENDGLVTNIESWLLCKYRY